MQGFSCYISASLLQLSALFSCCLKAESVFIRLLIRFPDCLSVVVLHKLTSQTCSTFLYTASASVLIHTLLLLLLLTALFCFAFVIQLDIYPGVKKFQFCNAIYSTDLLLCSNPVNWNMSKQPERNSRQKMKLAWKPRNFTNLPTTYLCVCCFIAWIIFYVIFCFEKCHAMLFQTKH